MKANKKADGAKPAAWWTQPLQNKNIIKKVEIKWNEMKLTNK